MKLESELPNYLNKRFFKTALEFGLKAAPIDIKRIIFTDPNSIAGDGENYCSKIFRAQIFYCSNKCQLDEKKDLIIKIIPITPATEFLKDLEVFLKERIFYFDVLDSLEKFIGDGTKFAAKTQEPIQALVFDDLTQYGYKLTSRQKGLNEDHCVVLLKKLGKFHSSSMTLIEKVPSIREHFKSGMLDENYIRTNKRFVNFASLQLRTLSNIVSRWNGYEKIAQKLVKYCDNIVENLIKTGRNIKGELVVLNHGDLWINNFLFKYDENTKSDIIDIIFIDFQTSFFGSPACDINFFLNNSVQLNVLKNSREFLIETYYQSLRESLVRMNYKEVPTLDCIKNEINSHEMYGFFSAYSFLPMVAMKKEDSENISMETFVDLELAKSKMELMLYSNPRTLETLRYSLKRFESLGLFQ